MVDFFLILFFGGLMSFCLYWKHILMMLLSLEFMMLSLFIMIIVMFIENMYIMFSYFMVLSVCEASLGLSLLVLIIFLGDSKYFYSLDVLKW